MTSYIASIYCNHDCTGAVFAYQKFDPDSKTPLGPIKLQTILWTDKGSFSIANLSKEVEWGDLLNSTVYLAKHGEYQEVPDSIEICSCSSVKEHMAELQNAAIKHIAALKFKRAI